MSRSVVPDCEKIKQLRLENGWRVEDLAAKSGCSVKSIRSAEKCSRIFLYTLTKLAQAFGVPNAQLIPSGKRVPKLPDIAGMPDGMVVLTIPFDAFDESDDMFTFIKDVKKLIKNRGVIIPLSVERGSTVIKLKMAPAVAVALETTLRNKAAKLKARYELNILSIDLSNGTHISLTDDELLGFRGDSKGGSTKSG